MAEIIILKRFNDLSGCLTVIQDQVRFAIKRIFFIEGASGYVRGGHRHKNTEQALICLSGTCMISNHDGLLQQNFSLNSSDKCLILKPEDWHTMHSFSYHAILLVLASTEYDKDDYIDEPYG